MSFDWTRFEHNLFLKTDHTTLWRKLSTAEGLQFWFKQQVRFLNSENDIVSSITSAKFVAWRHSDSDQWEKNQILEVVDGKRATIAFESEFVRVTFDISSAVDGYMKLTLIQESMPDTPEAHINWHLSCRLGWAYFLHNLKSRLAGGVDLRGPTRNLEFDPGRLNGRF